MKNIAVIMTVHNRKNTTLNCLKSFLLNRFSKATIDIHLMDDGSTDGTSKEISKQFPQVILQSGNGNLFWNRGMYNCWKNVINDKYDFYLWLNDDTMLFPNALEELIFTYNNNKEKTIVVGSICSPQDNKKITYGGRIGNKLIAPSDNVMEIETFNGNLVLIPAIVVKEIGINDPYFHHSFGDIEYGLRAKKHGINIAITNKFVGICERHDFTMKCFNSKYKLADRIKHFYSPLGLNPYEFFYLNKKYKGLFIAIKTYITTHLRVLIPQLWE